MTKHTLELWQARLGRLRGGIESVLDDGGQTLLTIQLSWTGGLVHIADYKCDGDEDEVRPSPSLISYTKLSTVNPINGPNQPSYQDVESPRYWGYSVVGTVRSVSKTAHLRKLFGNNENLSFAIVSDMTTTDAFNEVVKANQFSAVIHNSSPFTFEVNDVAKDLYEPAVKGTVGLLKSVKTFGPTVKQVVVLSSFASVIDGSKGDRPGHAYAEKDWNPITWEAGLANGNIGYYASKKLAEEAAWRFLEEERPHFSLTTLCPPMVYGPPEQEITDLNKLNTSDAEIYAYFTGAKEPRNEAWLWVDVRDIALAHALAIETPAAANQRYIISEGRFSTQQFIELIWKHHPERAAAKHIPKPVPREEYYPAAGTYGVDNSKSRKDLGIVYRSFEESAVDTFKKLEALEEELKN